jgi:hypothetical protein
VTDNPSPTPLTVRVDLAGELLGYSGRAASYGAVEAGVIPILPGPGRKRVPVARLEALVGRPITVADVEAAEARLKPSREKFLKYQAEYREARKALAGRRTDPAGVLARECPGSGPPAARLREAV